MTTVAKPFVAYLRVSTARQGSSGLGLEAQRAAIRQHLGGEPLAEFEEVETGKGADALDKRPVLRAALDYARKHRATLIVAKLDRLSRDVAFLAQFMNVGVDFVAADNPHASRFTMHILASVAEYERDAISARTKAALAAAKARGTVLGANGKVLAAKHKAEALAALEPAKGYLLGMKEGGYSVRVIADTLNDHGIPAPGGKGWGASNTHRALKRLAEGV